MQAILLCAGFATRMHPLTENLPKPLLKVAGRPVIDYLVEQLVGLPHLRAIHIVSNARFYDHFAAWRDKRQKDSAGRSIDIHVYNDGATANDNRLGAVADLQLAVKKIRQAGKLLVSAGDNIYRFPLQPLMQRFMKSGRHYVVALPETNPAALQRTGVLELEQNGRVSRLHEKPAAPPSHWICPPLYFFQATALPQLDAFLQTVEKPDAPGHFLGYLCRLEPVYAFRLKSSRLDIGSIDTFQRADRFLTENPLFDWKWDKSDLP
jgi:glucose-1-phosphate thymidylyltransferase